MKINSILPRLLLASLTLLVVPVISQAQPNAILMQNNVVANGNGTSLNTDQRTTAAIVVNCISCSGGTTFNFEGTINGTDYASVTATKLPGTTTATSATTSGVTNWTIPVAGLLNVRVRVSAYSAGTVLITGTTTNTVTAPASGSATITGDVNVTNSGTFSVQCSSGCSGGTTDTDDGTVAGGQTIGLVGSETMVWDGSNWKRLTIGTAGTSSAQVLSIQGIASGTTVPVTGTITAVTAITNALPAGSNVIGHVIVDTTSTTAVTQATGTNLHMVVDSGTVTTVSSVTSVGAVICGSGATNLCKNEDAVAASGDALVPAGCVIQASLSAPAADGDYTVPKCDANGAIWTKSINIDAAEDAAVATSPVPVGGVYRTAANSPILDTGDVGYIAIDQDNRTITKPYADRGDDLVGLITTAMTSTTSTAVTGMGAQAGSLRNYVTMCTASNSSATVPTDILLQDGSGGTTLFTIPAPNGTGTGTGGGGSTIVFPNPLKTTAATALYAANVTTGSSTKLSCTGFKAL